VILNMILAAHSHFFGWGNRNIRSAWAGAAISSLIAIVVGIVWLAWYFIQKDSFLRFEVAIWKPQIDAWERRMLLHRPADGIRVSPITALYIGIVYIVARPFGSAAQAGFGIGQRIIQAGFMPVVALGFAVE